MNHVKMEKAALLAGGGGLQMQFAYYPNSQKSLDQARGWLSLLLSRVEAA